MHPIQDGTLEELGILVVESRLVFSLVEAFFGGSGSGSTKIEGREFTSIEKKIIEKVVQMALVNLIEAWEEINPIKTEFVRSKSEPAASSMLCLERNCSKFQVAKIQDNKVLGNIIFMRAIHFLSPIRNKLAGDYEMKPR